MNLYLSAKSIVIVYLQTDKLRLAFVKYSLQSLNIVLQMKTIVNGSLTIVYKSSLSTVKLCLAHFCEFGVPYAFTVVKLSLSFVNHSLQTVSYS